MAVVGRLSFVVGNFVLHAAKLHKKSHMCKLNFAFFRKTHNFGRKSISAGQKNALILHPKLKYYHATQKLRLFR